MVAWNKEQLEQEEPYCLEACHKDTQFEALFPKHRDLQESSICRLLLDYACLINSYLQEVPQCQLFQACTRILRELGSIAASHASNP